MQLFNAPARRVAPVAAAMVLTGVVATSIPLAVRAITVRRFGLPGVGLFDVAWNISMNYIVLAIASWSTYYVPSLSRLSLSRDRHELIHRVLRLSIMLMAPLVVAVTVLKPAVVRILYSSAFLPALDIMRWMLIGDYLKVTSWIFAMPMIAYADVKTLFWSEIVGGGAHVAGAAFALLYLHSLQGVGANFVLNYASYLIFILFYVIRRRHFALDLPIARTWLIGLALILAASAHTWADVHVQPALAAAYIGAATCFSWTILTAEERRSLRGSLRRAFRRHSPPLPEPF